MLRGAWTHCAHPGSDAGRTPTVYIPQRGVQWKQGVVIYMNLYTSLPYNTTPIHCTPDPFPPLCRVSTPASRHPRTRVCIHTVMLLHVYMCNLSLSLYMYIYIYTHVYACVCIYIYIYIYIYMYTHVYVYVYKYDILLL